MQLRDTGTQRGLREGSGRGHGDPAHATQAAHRTAGGQKGLLLVFPQQSRNKQTMAPSSLCSLLRTAGGLSGTGGLACWNQAQVRLSWVSGMVFYRAVWLADWGPPTASGGRRQAGRRLPGLGWFPAAWCSCSPSSSSAVAPMTCLPA